MGSEMCIRDSIPIIVQYNKRDLDDLLSEEELDRHFCFRDDITTFPSVATEGHGVFEAFVEASVSLVERKVALYGLAQSESAPREVAEEVRKKLWDICDEVRRAREVVAVEDLPQTRLALADEAEDQNAIDRIADLSSSQPQAGVEPGDDEEHGGVELRESAPMVSEPDVNLSAGDDEFDFGYELRESAGTTRATSGDHAVGSDGGLDGALLSDDELDIDLSAGMVEFSSEPTEESEPDLLDKTVKSNLELAGKFGELDEQRLLLERKVHELVDVAQCTVHDLNKPISAVRLMLSTLNKGYLGDLTDTQGQAVAVSYTHLTLPTSDLV